MSDSDDEDVIPTFERMQDVFTLVYKQVLAAESLIPGTQIGVRSKPFKKPRKKSKMDKTTLAKITDDKPRSSKEIESIDLTEDEDAFVVDLTEDDTDTDTDDDEIKDSTWTPAKESQNPGPTFYVANNQNSLKRKMTNSFHQKSKISKARNYVNSSDEESFDSIEKKLPDPVEPSYTVLISWEQDLFRFTKPQNTKIAQIRMELAEKVSKRPDNLIILDGMDEVSDNLAISEIPRGKVLEAFDRDLNQNYIGTADLKDSNSEYISIRLQGQKGYRERHSVVMKKLTYVKQLVEDYIEKFGLHGKRFKLMMDGENINLSETPASLQLDNNDMLDVVEI